MGAMSRIKIQHGTRNTYERHKCRCEECRKANSERHSRWVVKNRDRNRELAMESYVRNAEEIIGRRKEAYDPVKNSARCAVTRAIRKGILVRESCEVGEDCHGAVQAHHDDYSKHLDVRWLCRRHHKFADMGLAA